MATEEQKASSGVFGDPEQLSLVPIPAAWLRLAKIMKVKGIEVGHRGRTVTWATADDDAEPVS